MENTRRNTYDAAFKLKAIELAVKEANRAAARKVDTDSDNEKETEELITVYTVPGMDPDWLVGERANDKGKVPVTYLELLS